MLNSNSSLKEILEDCETLFSTDLKRIAKSIIIVNKFKDAFRNKETAFFSYKREDDYNYDFYICIFLHTNVNPFDIVNNTIYSPLTISIKRLKDESFINEYVHIPMEFHKILPDTIKEITKEELLAKYKEALEIKLKQLNTK
jgi:hypothetical protein